MTDRLGLAQAFLQEAVFRSRARQAAGGGLLGASPDDDFVVGRCGLGEGAAVELDLSERGRELYGELWPDGLEAADLQRVHERMKAWIQRQDALDRKRNHFLRDFRHEHGFDRNAYAPEQTESFERGLAAVNAEVDEALAGAARELLGSA